MSTPEFRLGVVCVIALVLLTLAVCVALAW